MLYLFEILSIPRGYLGAPVATLFFLAALAPAAFAAELRISLRLSTDVPRAEPVPAVLSVSTEAVGDQPAVTLEKPVTVPGQTTLGLAAGKSWRLALLSQEIWLPETVVLGSAVAEDLILDAWPLTEVHGQITLPEDERAPPEHLDALITSAPETPASQAFARSVFRCPIQDGRWACRLPAGVVDLKLKARGFMPQYFWGLQIPVGKPTDLGKLALRRGSAISGHIELDGRAKEGTHTEIELVPLETAQRPVEEKVGEAQRQVFRREVQEPNARGFFLFLGVAPGGYEIIARHEGFAEARTGTINVLKDVEMELAQPLLLAPPLQLEVLLTPPTDPRGEPWVVGLARFGGSPRPQLVRQSPAELSGWWHLDGLSPGKYQLGVQTSEKVDFWHTQEVDLTQASATLQVEIPFLYLRGELLLGKEPLEADIHLTTGSAAMRFTSDSEGKFEGFVTKPGIWKAVILARKMQLMKRLSEVEIRSTENANEGEVVIEIADNRLTGRVIDESGAATKGTVYALGTANDAIRSVATDKEGEFELRGLDNDRFYVTALTPDDQSSDQVMVEVEEKLEPTPLELVVREKISIDGRLVFDGTGIPEVNIIASPADRPFSINRPLVSDIEGKFNVKVPKETRALWLIAMARGFALRMLTVPVEPGRRLEIPLSQVGGDLLLEFSQAPDLDFHSGVSYLILHNGAWADAMALRDWARGHSGKGWLDPTRLAIPNLEPGSYAFCSIRNSDLQTTVRGAPPPGRCVSGTVVPGAELSLKVPPPPKLE